MRLLLTKFSLFIFLFFAGIMPAMAEVPNSSNIFGLICDKLSRWNSIRYTMDMTISGEKYVYEVAYRKPEQLKTISYHKKDNADKIVMIVFKNTTTVFDYKKKDKETFDTGEFDYFRINNEYNKDWIVEYKGTYELSFKKDKKKEKRACWVVYFITPQGVLYKYWIDQYTGIALRMEVCLRRDEEPYIISITKEFKLDKPIKDSEFNDPF